MKVAILEKLKKIGNWETNNAQITSMRATKFTPQATQQKIIGPISSSMYCREPKRQLNFHPKNDQIYWWSLADINHLFTTKNNNNNTPYEDL